MDARGEDRGAALIIVMVFAAMLATFAATILYEGYTKARAVDLSAQVSQNQLLAEAALAAARDDLDNGGTGEIGTVGWNDSNGNGLADWNEVKDLAGAPVGFAGGHYWAQVTPLDDPNVPLYKRIRAYGRVDSGPAVWRDADGNVQRSVTRIAMVVMGKTTVSEPHPAFTGQYAIYAGGGDPDYRLRFGGQTGGGRWGGNHADLIEGDIFVDGDVQGTGNSQATGKVTATGAVTGTMRNSGGGIEENADPITPPDFSLMDYRNTCDVNVTQALDGNDTIQITNYSGLESGDIVAEGITTVPASNPAHIFSKESFKDDAYSGGQYQTDATNYHLGDWVSSTDGEDIAVGDNGNNKVYYVDGNLWLDTLNFGPTLRYTGSDPDDGVRITVVVEGNIYIGDNLKYSSEKDGIALIAIKSDQTRTEGSGNIFFGDLSASWGGLDVNALLFAENTFSDVVKGAGDTPLEFTVNGLMAAGGRVELQDRGQGLQHVKMVIRHDPRLMDGSLSLPGLPIIQAEPLNPIPPGPPWKVQVRWQARR